MFGFCEIYVAPTLFWSCGDLPALLGRIPQVTLHALSQERIGT
jgi:hypothetical protein